jgi:hypothetical protein
MHLTRGTCRHSPVPIDPIELRPEPTGWCSAVAFPSRERARALRALLRFALCLSVSHLHLAHMRLSSIEKTELLLSASCAVPSRLLQTVATNSLDVKLIIHTSSHCIRFDAASPPHACQAHCGDVCSLRSHPSIPAHWRPCASPWSGLRRLYSCSAAGAIQSRLHHVF